MGALNGVERGERLWLDQEFENYHLIKCYRIQVYGEKVVRALDSQPGIVSSGRPAAWDVVDELAEYLMRIYPPVLCYPEPHIRQGRKWVAREGQILGMIMLKGVGQTLDLGYV